jgi:transposase
MQIDLTDLPQDPALLQRLVTDMAAGLSQRDGEIDRLQQIIKGLQRAQYGRRSEQLETDTDQISLALDDLISDVAYAGSDLDECPAPDPDIQAKGGRRSLPEHLPRADVVLEPGHDACPDCGGALRGAGEHVSEMLDWIPAKLRVIRIHRPKKACKGCASIYQAPAPERAISKGLATPALIAQVLISKYCDHTPLYRQSQILARQGVTLGRSTLANWVGGACWWLDTLHDRLQHHINTTSHLFADDTTIPVLDPGRGRTKTGRLWVYVRDGRGWGERAPPIALYHYAPDRKAVRPELHLKDFTGTLHVDGYAGFGTLSAKTEINLAACWAHTRRKFYEVHQATGSPIAQEMLSRIALLYKIEKSVRGQSPEVRQKARRKYAQRMIKDMKPWLETQLARISAGSTLAGAIKYALGRWGALRRFLVDGKVELDTNPVERAIRPVALGRKNHMFAGSDKGGHRWAIICSLIETAKLNKVEPHAYITDVLTRMTNGHPASQIDDLLPWNWTSTAK